MSDPEQEEGEESLGQADGALPFSPGSDEKMLAGKLAKRFCRGINVCRLDGQYS